MTTLENTFIASLKFGFRDILKVVIAKNKQDALKTIADYYDEPNITALLSMQEIYELAEENGIEQKLSLVIEAIHNDDGLDMIIHKEFNKKIEDLESKYANKETIIYSSSALTLIIEAILSYLQSTNEDPLISESIQL